MNKKEIARIQATPFKDLPINKRPFKLKENWRHKNIFETYLLMGPGRTLIELARMNNVNYRSVCTWNKVFDWPSRLVARDQKALGQLSDLTDKLYLEKVKRKHLELYEKVQAKAMRALEKKKLNFENDKDATIALDIGIKGEREILGLRDTKIKGAILKEGFAALLEATIGPDS